MKEECGSFVDTTSRRWSLAVIGARVSQAMLSVAGGGLPAQFVCPGQATQPDYPVSCSATFKAASTRPCGIAKGAGAAGAVDLRHATIATFVDWRRPKAARFALAGVRLESRLFRRSGMELAVNGTAIRVGRFEKDGNAYVGKVRLADGVRGECRYASGTLSLSLKGGEPLRPPDRGVRGPERGARGRERRRRAVRLTGAGRDKHDRDQAGARDDVLGALRWNVRGATGRRPGLLAGRGGLQVAPHAVDVARAAAGAHAGRPRPARGQIYARDG